MWLIGQVAKAAPVFGVEPAACKLLKELVGARGFEPPASWSRTRRSTRLSHAPNTDTSLVVHTPMMQLLVLSHARKSLTWEGIQRIFTARGLLLDGGNIEQHGYQRAEAGHQGAAGRDRAHSPARRTESSGNVCSYSG